MLLIFIDYLSLLQIDQPPPPAQWFWKRENGGECIDYYVSADDETQVTRVTYSKLNIWFFE